MTALVLPAILAVVGMGIDSARLLETRSRLQAAMDAASLATASALAAETIRPENARDFAVLLAAGQLSSSLTASQLTEFKSSLQASTSVTTTDRANSYSVALWGSTSQQLTVFSVFLGVKALPVSASSQANSGTKTTKGAISLFLVLDRSLSMNEDTKTLASASKACSSKNANRNTCSHRYLTKLEALQRSVEHLASEFSEADPDDKFIRTGAVSYNSLTQKASGMQWNKSDVVNYVDALTALGLTDSSGAMKVAYDTLSGSSENVMHASKNGLLPKKYIVFMTDGENGTIRADNSTKNWCNKAKQQNIEIFAIAFEAPTRGQNLLRACATDTQHYFNAEDADDVFEAFQVIGNSATAQVSRLSQ